MTMTDNRDVEFAVAIANSGGPVSYFERVVGPMIEAILDSARPDFNDPAKRAAALITVVEIPFNAMHLAQAPEAAQWPLMASALFWGAYLDGRATREKIGIESITQEEKISLVQRLVAIGVQKDEGLDLLIPPTHQNSRENP